MGTAKKQRIVWFNTLSDMDKISVISSGHQTFNGCRTCRIKDTFICDNIFYERQDLASQKWSPEETRRQRSMVCIENHYDWWYEPVTLSQFRRDVLLDR